MHSGENVHVHSFRILNISMWKSYIYMCASFNTRVQGTLDVLKNIILSHDT